MDELIAERVLGYTRRPDGSWRYNDQNYSGIPSFSTSLEAAFAVADLVQYAKGCDFELTRLNWERLMDFNARFGGISTGHGEGTTSIGTGSSSSAAHAICLAALRAVGAL